MMKYNINPGRRSELKRHILDRQSLKTVAKTLPDPFKYTVKGFLGGTRRKRKTKRRR